MQCYGLLVVVACLVNFFSFSGNGDSNDRPRECGHGAVLEILPNTVRIRIICVKFSISAIFFSHTHRRQSSSRLFSINPHQTDCDHHTARPQTHNLHLISRKSDQTHTPQQQTVLSSPPEMQAQQPNAPGQHPNGTAPNAGNATNSNPPLRPGIPPNFQQPHFNLPLNLTRDQIQSMIQVHSIVWRWIN